MAGDVGVGGHKPVNFVASPGSLRREMVGANGTSVETVLVVATLPLVAVQWRGAQGADLGLTLLPYAPRPLVTASGPTLVVQVPDNNDEVIVLTLDGAAGEWRLDGGASSGIRASTDLLEADRHTLFCAAGTERAVRGALAARSHIDVHERAAQVRPARGLTVTTGVRELDEGLAWATVRLRCSLMRGAVDTSRSPPTIAIPGFFSGIGALTTGDFEAVSVALAAWPPSVASDADPNPVWPAAPLSALLHAHATLASGDAGFARPMAREVLAGAPQAGGDPALWALAVDRLADAMRHADSDDRIAELRAAAPPPAAMTTQGALPVIGSGRPTAAHFLRRVLSGSAAEAPPTGTAALDAALAGWNSVVADPERGWSLLRGLFREGVEAGPQGPGTWDASDPLSASGAPVTGTLLAGFVLGGLGAVPDAPSGRLRLGPNFDSHVTSVRVDGIPLGGSVVGMTYLRTGSVHDFSLEPTVARTPPTIVFEPSLAATELLGAEVDGEPAELDWSATPSRITPRVQLPLDGTRHVRIETA